jgi:hypothetical protein
MFQKKFPDKETKLIIGCSDGKSYCLDALDALDEAGYVNLVALKGGYYAWFKRWDNNLRRCARCTRARPLHWRPAPASPAPHPCPAGAAATATLRTTTTRRTAAASTAPAPASTASTRSRRGRPPSTRAPAAQRA